MFLLDLKISVFSFEIAFEGFRCYSALTSRLGLSLCMYLHVVFILNNICVMFYVFLKGSYWVY